MLSATWSTNKRSVIFIAEFQTGITVDAAELAAICSKLGRIPTVAEYHADMGVINQDADKIYRYMSFDQIDEYRGVADAAKV